MRTRQLLTKVVFRETGRAFVYAGVIAEFVPLRCYLVDDVFIAHTGSTIRDAEESTAADRNRMVMKAFAGSRR